MLPIVFLDQPGRQLPSRPDVDRANLDDRPWSTAAGNQWDILAIYGSCREWRVLEQSCLRMEPYKPSASARSGIIGPERLLGIASQTRMCRNLTAILRCIGSIHYMTVRHVVRPARSRSEERRVGKEWVSTGRFRWSP